MIQRIRFLSIWSQTILWIAWCGSCIIIREWIGQLWFCGIYQRCICRESVFKLVPFLLNNMEFLFKNGGNAYDVIADQCMFEKWRRYFWSCRKKGLCFFIKSSIVGIVPNLFLCTTKIAVGFLSHSVAISADGFNNLSDAGMSFITFLGFQVAKYGKGRVSPFVHGRFEWIVGIFTSPFRDCHGNKALLHFCPGCRESGAASVWRGCWHCSCAVHRGKGLYVSLKQAVRENNGFGNFGSNGRGLYQRFRCDCFIQLAFLIDMVRSVDLARHMGYSKSSISRTVSILCKGGFLVKDDSGFFAFDWSGAGNCWKILRYLDNSRKHSFQPVENMLKYTLFNERR